MLDVGKMVDAVLDAIERPLAAFSARLKAIEERPLPEKGDKGDPGPPGADGLSVKGDKGEPGRDGRDGRDAEPGKDGQDGAPGRDGFGFEHLDVVAVDERSFSISFTRDDETKQFVLKFSVPLYRGVYQPGKSYERGDMVSFGGSIFHANDDTADKPEEGGRWTLAVKRGRDGRSVAK